jgi:hypothetical protein
MLVLSPLNGQQVFILFSERCCREIEEFASIDACTADKDYRWGRQIRNPLAPCPKGRHRRLEAGGG